jgi:hypothetical protein
MMATAELVIELLFPDIQWKTSVRLLISTLHSRLHSTDFIMVNAAVRKNDRIVSCHSSLPREHPGIFMERDLFEQIRHYATMCLVARQDQKKAVELANKLKSELIRYPTLTHNKSY